MLLVGDTGPVTACCGCWPVARTPHTVGYLRRRFVTDVAELDRLLTMQWVAIHCPACRKLILP